MPNDVCTPAIAAPWTPEQVETSAKVLILPWDSAVATLDPRLRGDTMKRTFAAASNKSGVTILEVPKARYG